MGGRQIYESLDEVSRACKARSVGDGVGWGNSSVCVVRVNFMQGCIQLITR